MNEVKQQQPAAEYYLISKTLADKILNYLARKPYLEVADLIKEMYSLPPVKAEILIPTDPQA